MPPHCDALDGPVVNAARRALVTGNINLVLPFVPEDAEAEVREAFARTAPLMANDAARAVAEAFFFETVVRLHRAGEGEPFTGLKPAGLDVGPVIPLAERAIEQEDPEELIRALQRMVERGARERFERMMRLKASATASVPAAREYVSEMLGLQVWSHKLARAIDAPAHEHAHAVAAAR